MSLPPQDWLPFAQACPVGGKAQHQHVCGTGRKLLVENKPNGYAAWCYRCNEGGWVPKTLTLAQRIARLSEIRSIDRTIGSTKAPPMPAVFDPKEWPDEAKVWLYRAGLDNDWIADLGFYWCPPAERVVMPVLDDGGKLQFWQARGFDPARPKYLSAPLADDAAKPIYKAHPSRPQEGFDAKILCLTEDILSAVKVGQAVTGWSILGTALTPLVEAEIAKFGPSKVLVWLDPDDAGVKARRKIVPALRSMGFDATAVRAELDPKLYPLTEITRKLLT